MSDVFSDLPLELECPNCGHQFEENIGRLEDDPDLACPACGKTIGINAEELRSGLDAANKATDDFFRNVRKISD